MAGDAPYPQVQHWISVLGLMTGALVWETDLDVNPGSTAQTSWNHVLWRSELEP